MIPSTLLVMSVPVEDDLAFLEAANSAYSVGAPASSASATINSNGTFQFVGDASATPNYDWLLSGPASDYEARFSTASALNTGSANVWIDCSSSPSWSVLATTGQFKTAAGTIEIRRASDGVVLASGSLTLEADAT